MATDKLQFVDIEKIHWQPRARTDLGDIDSLAEQIKDKGVLQPITVDKDYLLLAGERRITAAKKAGLTKIPCLIRDTKGDIVDQLEIELIENVFRKDFNWNEQAQLIARLDSHCKENKTEWSTRKTAQLLGHVHPMNVVRALKLVDAIGVLPEIANCKTQDEALKMINKVQETMVTTELRARQETIQDKGLKTMLRIASNNYNIGDALKGMAAMAKGSPISFIEVDPPYGIDLGTQKKQVDGTNIVKTYAEVPTAEYQAFIEIVAEETYRVAGQNCWMIFWFGPTHHQIVLTGLRKAGWEVDEIPAIWTKKIGQTNAPEVYLARTYEPFFVCRKGKPALHKRGRANVFECLPVVGTKKYHPTERPVQLMLDILETFCFPGISAGGMLVPFLGSGVTLRAGYLYGIQGFGWDLNPEYKDKFLLAVQADTEALNKEEEAEDD